MNSFPFEARPDVHIVEGSQAEALDDRLRTMIQTGSRSAKILHDIIASWIKGEMRGFCHEFYLNSTRELVVSIAKYSDIRCSFYYTRSMTSSDIYLFQIEFMDLEYWRSTGALGIPARNHSGVGAKPSTEQIKKGDAAESRGENDHLYRALLSILPSGGDFDLGGISISRFDDCQTFNGDIGVITVGGSGSPSVIAAGDGLSYVESRGTVTVTSSGGWDTITRSVASTVSGGTSASTLISMGDIGCGGPVDSSVSGDVGDARLAADWTILPTIVASNAAARSGSATVQRNGTGTRAVRMRVGTEGHAASVRSGAGTFASNTVRAFLGRTEICCGQACFEGTIAATALASSIDQHAARHGDHGARYDCFDATEIVLARRPHSTFWVNEDPRCKAIPVTTCRAATLSALELSGA